MGKSPIKLSIIGCGFCAQNIHLPRLLRLPEKFKVVAVADIDPDKARQAAAIAGNCPAYFDYGTMMDEVEADAAVILTSLHHEPSRKALLKGLDLFIEKPVCETVQQAEEIIQLAEVNNKIIFTGAMRIFDPGLERLKDIIKQIEPIRWVEIRDYCGSGSSTGGGDMVASGFQAGLSVKKAREKNLLQALLLEFIHDISILRFLFEGRIEVKDAWVEEDGWSANGRLELLDHIPCVYSFCEFGLTSAPVFDLSIRLFGEKGCAEASFGDPNESGGSRTTIYRNFQISEEMVCDSYEKEWLVFYDAIQQRQHFINNGQDGLKDIELAWRIFEKSLR